MLWQLSLHMLICSSYTLPGPKEKLKIQLLPAKEVNIQIPSERGRSFCNFVAPMLFHVLRG